MGQLSVAVVAEPLWHSVPGGTGRATRELIDGLAARPDVHLTAVHALHRRGDERVSSGIETQRWNTPRVVLYESWARFGGRPGTSRVARGVDLVHSPMLPAPRRGDRPLVVTLHDLAFMQQPDATPARPRRLYERIWSRVREEADLVLCSSEVTRSVAIGAGLSRDRSRVVPLGATVSAVSSDDRDRVRRVHHLSDRYVLFVGTAEPRKNLAGLLAGYAKSVLPADGVELVIVGPKGWREHLGQRLRELPPEASSRVRSLGEVDDSDLHALYAEAAIFCYPSILEGFGLPVLEAMAHGTPVITSQGTATAEVAGDTALLVDPLSADELAERLDELARDTDLATELGVRGLARAEEFSWDRHIDLTLEAYRDVIG